MAQRIVILGGGFAGMYTARELRRRLGSAVEIEVINDKNYFVFQPLLPEVGAGSIGAINAVTPLRFLLRGIFVRKAKVDSVDFEAKTVTVFQGVQRRPTVVPYDHLVIALGQGSDLSRTPGLAEHALTMKTLEDARRLRGHVIERLEHAEITGLPEVKRGALTFCVIGAGFSGIETVGEMKELIDRSLKYYPNIDPSEVRVIVIEFADRILGEMPDRLASYAKDKLAARGVEVQLGTGVASATGTQLVTTTGEVIDTRTIVATIGNAPSPVVQKMDLPLEFGKVAVERDFQVKGGTNVWSLGDCALIPMKDNATERGDFAPPTAQFAVREARQLAANMEANIKGKPTKPFAYKSQGALASLGAGRGIAEVWGMTFTGLFAWLLWRAYYLMFLPGFWTRISVLFNWTMDLLSARSVVQIDTAPRTGARHVHYRAGDRIYETGNRADGFYTILSGKVEVSRADDSTGETVTRTIGAGEHFGERLLLGETKRLATVRAVEDTVVLVLDRDEFEKLSDGFGAFRTYFDSYIEQTFGHDLAAKRAAE